MEEYFRKRDAQTEADLERGRRAAKGPLGLLPAALLYGLGTGRHRIELDKAHDLAYEDFPPSIRYRVRGKNQKKAA